MRYRPRFEALEARHLPSTVTTLMDNVPGSLRNAIATGTFDNGNPFASQLAQFFAYDLSLSTGVTVGSADFEHNGHFDILTGATQGPPEFRVVSGLASGVRPPAVNGLDGVASDLQDNLYVGA